MRRTNAEPRIKNRRLTTKSNWATLAGLLVLTAAEALAQKHQLRSGQPVLPEEAQPERRIVVSIPDRELALVENGRVVKVYRVAVGARSSPSPTGEFRIVRPVSNPAFYSPDSPRRVIPPGPENPVGPRWLGLSLRGYGIHGTNEPRSIGRHASHGCIRLRNRDIEELFARVRVGDVVELRGKRDEVTAELFHTPLVNPHEPEPTMVAEVAGH